MAIGATAEAFRLYGDMRYRRKANRLAEEIAKLHRKVPAKFILNPKDFHDIELIKDQAGRVNTGKHLVGDPLGGTLGVPPYCGDNQR